MDDRDCLCAQMNDEDGNGNTPTVITKAAPPGCIDLSNNAKGFDLFHPSFFLYLTQ